MGRNQTEEKNKIIKLCSWNIKMIAIYSFYTHVAQTHSRIDSKKNSRQQRLIKISINSIGIVINCTFSIKINCYVMLMLNKRHENSFNKYTVPDSKKKKRQKWFIICSSTRTQQTKDSFHLQWQLSKQKSHSCQT